MWFPDLGTFSECSVKVCQELITLGRWWINSLKPSDLGPTIPSSDATLDGPWLAGGWELSRLVSRHLLAPGWRLEREADASLSIKVAGSYFRILPRAKQADVEADVRAVGAPKEGVLPEFEWLSRHSGAFKLCLHSARPI